VHDVRFGGRVQLDHRLPHRSADPARVQVLRRHERHQLGHGRRHRRHERHRRHCRRPPGRHGLDGELDAVDRHRHLGPRGLLVGWNTWPPVGQLPDDGNHADHLPGAEAVPGFVDHRSDWDARPVLREHGREQHRRQHGVRRRDRSPSQGRLGLLHQAARSEVVFILPPVP